MSDFDTEVTIPDPDQGLEESEDSSLIARLKEQRKSVASQTTADIDIPKYNGELFARYRLLDNSELNDIRRRVRAETRNGNEQIEAASLDTLIASCEEFFVRSDGREIALREVAGEEVPISYDAVLAEVMGFADELPKPPTARSVVIALFGGNVLAAQAHSAVVQQWMLGVDQGLDQQLGGI